MQSLQDVYNQIASQDVELEKQASELIKQAEEEDAAGRITARGFADELAKLAGNWSKMAGPYDAGASAFNTGPKGGAFQGASGGTVKSGPYQTGGGKTGGGFDLKGRPGAAAAGASAAGGSVAKPVGAPGMGRQSSMKPSAPPPKQPSLAAGAMKPPGGAGA